MKHVEHTRVEVVEIEHHSLNFFFVLFLSISDSLTARLTESLCTEEREREREREREKGEK